MVLSNNDGCAVTRSPEAKALGIRLGEPWFKLAPRAKEWGLVARSSNYELYGDISARVMELLGRYSAWLEVYSIDEAFLGVNGTPEELQRLGHTMKTAVRRNVGVPVCVGIAGTKTLAKLANKWAKHNPAFDGVCHWDSVPAAQREKLMAGLSVIELWGVATRLTKRLNALGIHSILDLARADPVRIRDRFSVVLMRTVLELNGTPCIPLEEERIGRDQLIFCRSFATPITTGAGLRQVLGVYAQQASARLARHGLQAKVLTAFAGHVLLQPAGHLVPLRVRAVADAHRGPGPPGEGGPRPAPPDRRRRQVRPRRDHGHRSAPHRQPGAPGHLRESARGTRHRHAAGGRQPTVRAGFHRPGLRRNPGRAGLEHETRHAVPALHDALGRTPRRQSRVTARGAAQKLTVAPHRDRVRASK